MPASIRNDQTLAYDPRSMLNFFILYIHHATYMFDEQITSPATHAATSLLSKHVAFSFRKAI